MKKFVYLDKLPSGNYRVRYWTIKNGKPHFASEGFVDYGLAKRRAADLEVSLLAKKQGQACSLARPYELYQEYINDPEANRGKPFADETKEMKLGLVPFISEIGMLTELTTSKIKNYLGKYENPTTKSIRYRDIHAFCVWCIKHGYMKENPFYFEGYNGVKQKLPQAKSLQRNTKLSLQEINTLIKHCTPALRLRLLQFVATGKRLSEVIKTEWQHLNFEDNTWFIPAANSKSKRDSTVPMPEWLMKDFKNEQIKRGQIVGLIHPKNNTARDLHALQKRAGLLVNVTPHVFRHSFASHWRGSPQVLMGLLGWTSPVMIQRYTHLNAEDLRQEAEKKGLSSNLNI